MSKIALGSQKGQALLIIILVMVVALTITLSVISRAVVNLRTTQEQEKSQKALAAAEAGIEQTIKNQFVPIAKQNFSNTDTSITTSVSIVQGNAAFAVDGGNVITQNDGAYIWLSSYEESPRWTTKYTGTVNIYWGDKSGDANNAALEIAVISGSNVANAEITRYAVDPSNNRIGSNNFSSPSKGTYSSIVAGKTYGYRTSITVTNGMLIRAIPLYKSTNMAVEPATGSPALPNQGRIITAVGESDNTARKVTVFQGYPELPAEFFPYSLLVP